MIPADYKMPETREELIDWFTKTTFFVPVEGDPNDRATYERMTEKELKRLFTETHNITPWT